MSNEKLLTDAKRLRAALAEYFGDLMRQAEGLPTLKDPFELARQAEIVLRDTAYLNAGQVGGWTVLGTLTPGE